MLSYIDYNPHHVNSPCQQPFALSVDDVNKIYTSQHVALYDPRDKKTIIHHLSLFESPDPVRDIAQLLHDRVLIRTSQIKNNLPILAWNTGAQA